MEDLLERRANSVELLDNEGRDMFAEFSLQEVFLLVDVRTFGLVFETHDIFENILVFRQFVLVEGFLLDLALEFDDFAHYNRALGLVERFGS